MAIFTLTNEQKQQFDQFTARVRQITEKLSGYGEDKDTAELEKLIKNFDAKVRDFFDNDRRLNIGIVGQVKAGKSSFLNTLLFDGKSVLPKASTPKTATLTRIEYAEENAMEIEYYSEDDWDGIIEDSKSKEESAEFEGARELVNMANESGVDISALLKKGRDRIVFTDYQELTEHLNDYVGENGKYTAIVKAVVLYASNPLFKELSIVDTPGLNDPVISRTLRTKEFIEVCDVVYFLTPCSAFLDKSDWTLLSTQLPQKGVKRLTLVGSKFDSGLRDVLYKSDPNDPFGKDPNKADNITEAIALVRKKLTTRAKQKVGEFEKHLKFRGADEELIGVLNGCREPLFVSAIARNMIGRDEKSLDAEERNVYNALSEFSSNLGAELERIGGFTEVSAVQNEVVAEKDQILSEKCASFVPTAKTEMYGLLTGFLDRAQKRCKMLSENDRTQLIAIKNDTQGRINNIRDHITEALGEWQRKIDSHKETGARDLRAATSKHQSLDERTGTETKTDNRKVKDSVWYKPWTWGRYHYESFNYNVSFSFIAASDALENLRRYAKESERRIEKVFSDAVSHHEMKRRLLGIVADNFNMRDERYDVSLFRGLVEEHIKKMTLPVIKLDCKREIDELAAKFNGKVRGNDMDKLRQAMTDAIDSVYATLARSLDEAANVYKSALNTTCESLREALLKDMVEEFEKILKDLDEKDASIARFTGYINTLETVIKEIKA